MGKRQIEEAALAGPHNGVVNRLENKKRKAKHRPATSAADDAEKTEQSKEERREQKKLKKLQDSESRESEVKTSDNVGKAVSKAARKAERARLKVSRNAEQNGLNGEADKIDNKNAPATEELGEGIIEGKDITNTAGTDAADTKATKEAKRTELKAQRALEKNAVEAAKKPRRNALRLSESLGTDREQDSEANGHSSSHNVPVKGSSTNYKEDPALTALPQSEIDSFLSSSFITITDPTTSEHLRPIISFSQLPASTRAGAGVSPFASFKSPTPIQSAAWPFLFSGRDVIGVAETGSGKTLAFGVPCIRYISSLPPQPKKTSSARAVIVSPTRELAVQIYEQILQLAKPAGLQAVCVYGGVPKDAQRLALMSSHIVVATPGRLNDLINEGAADLSNVRYLVLDEADRMLDKGFEEDIRKIISTTPSPSNGLGRQTLMFTATWPASVRDLAATFMRSPVKIAIGDNPTGELRANTRIVQKVEVVDPRSKEMRLLQLIKQYQSGKAKDDRILVFCLYKKEATRVEGFLRSKGLRVAGIHGDLSQEKRTSSLEAFKRDGGCPLLVATDVAARGLDIPAVKVVINVTFPLTVEDYVHRIGRTGRAGAEGLAITLFTDHDKAQSGSLINVLKAAGQPVPDELLKFGTTVKKKGHDAYGAFYKETENSKAATKIKFED
ncbi:MAG: hypothetical protein Q9187_005213 [Circinaria calcarea]